MKKQMTAQLQQLLTKKSASAIIDYGNGDCDTMSSVTKDGVTEQVDLKNKYPFCPTKKH